MESQHYEICEAPICAGDLNPDYKKEVLWYPGEAVCGLKATKFQRMQRKINKKVAKGTFKNTGLYFTAEMLEKLSKVMNGTKGKNPDK